MSKASDLIYEYVRAEVKIKEAKQALIDLADKKESLLQEIVACNPLKEALMTTGVTISGNRCNLSYIAGDYRITIYDEPVSAFSLSDEPEVMEEVDVSDLQIDVKTSELPPTVQGNSFAYASSAEVMESGDE